MTVPRPTKQPHNHTLPVPGNRTTERGTVQYWLGPTFSNPVQLITRNKWFVITSDQIPELKVAKFLGLDFALRMMAEYCLLALENYHEPGVVQLFRELPLHEVFSKRYGMEEIIKGYQDDPHSSLLEWLRALEDIAVLLTGHTATPFLFRLDQIAQTAIVKAKP